MSFWQTSSGEDVRENATGTFDAGGGDLEPIADNTNVLALIDSAGWKQDQSFNNYIEIVWAVQKPEAYANRKVWQKLWVSDPDPRAKDASKADAKRNKAIAMLGNIDTNAGGKLSKLSDAPTEDQLALALTGKAMVIKLRIWDMDDKKGNWVAAVMPKTHAISEVAAAPAKPKGNGTTTAQDLDDDIPF